MTTDDFMKLPDDVRDEIFVMWAQEEFPTKEIFMEHVVHAQICEECQMIMARRFGVFLARNVEMSVVDMRQQEKSVAKHLMN